MVKKRFLTYDEQIEFLKQKNLVINNDDKAKRILFKTGYFPLINGYKELFKNKETGHFKDDVSMDDLYGLYLFDSVLRSIFIKFILIVERNKKSSLSYHFCNEFGDSKSNYLNPGCYDYKGKKIPVIQKAIKVLSGQCRNDSDYVYIRHYMNRYEYVPLWILLHVLTLGHVLKLKYVRILEI